MPGTSDMAAESATSAHQDGSPESAKGSNDVPALFARVPIRGVWAWSFVGFARRRTIIVFVALAAVSEIVLPLTFAAVLAIIFKPLVRVLSNATRSGPPSPLASSSSGCSSWWPGSSSRPSGA